MKTVLIWWLWMEVTGLAALPLAYRFFRRLPDRGYAFARPLGLLLAGYVLWMGGSLGLLRNSLGGALFSLATVALVSVVVYHRGRPPEDPGLWAWLKENRRLVVAVELSFAGALALWSVLRAFSPDITTTGGEKFMEIMFLNSIGRSEYMPPHDAWLSGYAISYYYFGYVMMAMITRLSGIAAHLTYNVGLASLFAMTCTGAFGIVYNLVKGAKSPGGTASPSRPIVYGLLGSTLVAVLGNLEGFFEALYSLRLLPQAFWRWLDIMELNQPFNPALAPSLLPARSGWWWWRASRVINDLDPLGKPMGIEPIDEFPGFSFLLGDMHPHVLALPFVLLALVVVLRALLECGERADGAEPWWQPLRRLPLLVPLCIGALGFLNTWDLPTMLLIFALAYGLARRRAFEEWTWPYFRDVGLTVAATAIAGVLLYLPFYIGLQSQAGGILPALYVGTRFRHYFVMFGPFLVAIAGFLALAALQLKRRVGASLWRGWAGWTALFLLLPFGLMLLIAVGMIVLPQGRQFLEEIRRIPFIYQLVGDEAWPVVLGRLLVVKSRTWVMPTVVAAMAGLGAVLLRSRDSQFDSPSARDGESVLPAPQDLQPDASIQFALVCGVVGLLLTLSVEFVYLVDVFRVRMNTVFKFYFQAWVLLAIAAAFAVWWLNRQRGKLRLPFLACFWVLVAMGMVYPILANISRAGSFAAPPELDGTAYLATARPDDYAAIAWLNDNVPGSAVILEKPGTGGSSYVYEGRVSALTGLPALLGWGGHEGQWRGSYDVQSAREPDIQTIYNTRDPKAALDLLEKHGVSYVYVGELERAEYDARGLAKFDQVLDVVYRNNSVTIYRVRR